MPRNQIHLINELPHIYELEDMMEFCKKYDDIYIYMGERIIKNFC